MDEECHQDAVAIKLSATAAATPPSVVHPEGIQDGEKQDTGPR